MIANLDAPIVQCIVNVSSEYSSVLLLDIEV